MPASDYTPVSADVANVLRARTRDATGTEQGVFSAETRPTADNVDALAVMAAETVAGRHGADLDEVVWPAASWLATLETALLIELSYFPEQVNSNRSPYEHLLDLRDRAEASLVEALGRVASGGVDPDNPLPEYTFHDHDLISRETRW